MVPNFIWCFPIFLVCFCICCWFLDFNVLPGSTVWPSFGPRWAGRHRHMGLRRDDLRPLQQLLRAELANLHAGDLASTYGVGVLPSALDHLWIIYDIYIYIYVYIYIYIYDYIYDYMDDLWMWLMYPLVMTNIAIENGHWNSEFSHNKWWFFHSYVKLPEGKLWHLNIVETYCNNSNGW